MSSPNVYHIRIYRQCATQICEFLSIQSDLFSGNAGLIGLQDFEQKQSQPLKDKSMKWKNGQPLLGPVTTGDIATSG